MHIKILTSGSQPYEEKSKSHIIGSDMHLLAQQQTKGLVVYLVNTIHD